MNNMREIWRRILTVQSHKFPSRVQLYSFSWDKTILQNDEALP